MIYNTVKSQSQYYALDFYSMKFEWNLFMESSACGFSDNKEHAARCCNH